MLYRLNLLFQGDGFRARALRSSAVVGIGYAGANVLRLASNLILTRLLFPEAFGLMSLVYIFLTALHLFSDVGLNLSIIQNKRGEDPDFLNTIWSIQIIRGLLLWLGACALAFPAALLYREPQLGELLPAVGLTALIQGFTTTNAALAERNLQLGMRIAMDLVGQVVTLVVTSVGAWLTGSVWALVIGAIFGALLNVVLLQFFLKGPKNRWHIERGAVGEILHFGKYIFLGSVAGFLISQSDRAILGGFVSLSDLGVFTVGFMLANVPIDLTNSIGGRILLPLFSRFPPSQGTENRRKVLGARRLVLLVMASMTGVLALISLPLVGFLYDPRYHAAGPILALLCFTVTVRVAASSYDGAYLGVGDSRQHFSLVAIQAFIQVAVSLLLIPTYGIVGAVFVIGISEILSYPFRAFVVRRYDAWDPGTDAIALGIGWACSGLALWMWRDEIIQFALK